MADSGRPASKKLLAFLDRLGLKAKDPSIFGRALIHRSSLNESKTKTESNERLEFLGDAVLGLLVSDYLYDSFSGLSEGQMARRKAALVSEASLAEWSRSLKLGSQLSLGRGESLSGGREKPAILGDAFEAFLAAVYLDQGLEAARKFITPLLDKAAKDGNSFSGQDAKSRLQEITQQRFKKPPRYRVSKTAGPDHAKTFEVEVLAEGDILATGSGKNKKEAEQRAAEKALAQMQKSS